MKIIKKIMLAIIVLTQIFLLKGNTNAANIGENKTLTRGSLGYYCVQKWDGAKWVFLTYNTTYYKDTNGKQYVAYCLSPGAPGVGYVTGEKETYDVKIKEVVNDDRIWRIIKNGYPYKSVQDLGVETVDDAYFATMQAVNCVLRGYTLEQAKGLYTPGQFGVNGENYEDVQRRGKKTLDAMYSLINIGLNGTEKRADLLNINIQSVTDFVKESDTLYSQLFKVVSNSNISGYTVEKIENLPSGSYVADANGNKKASFKSGENFKIVIPKSSITKDINGKITVKVQQRNYPVFYGESQLEGYQDYALCSDEYSDVYATAEMKVVTNKSKLEIIKVDSKTNKPLKGVKFQITNSSNITNTYVTNDAGKIELSGLYAGTVKIKEIATIQNYKLLKDEITVNLSYGETKEIRIANELEVGSIQIEKVDKNNSSKKLANVKFTLTNESGKQVAEGVTDKNGILKIENLEVGTYYIKEVETQEDYVLSQDKVEVKVGANETVKVEIKNTLKTGNLQIEKVDKNHPEKKLKGVAFKLTNAVGKVVAEGVTDSNGILKFDNLEIGKYVLEEVKTQENYVLLDKKIDIEIKANETTKINLKNELKKGHIQIEKLDKDNPNIKLKNVTFKVTNEEGKIVAEGTTNKEGIARFDNLEIGKYVIEETKTLDNYVLSKEKVEVTVKANETIKVYMKNELKKGNLVIKKVDKDNSNIKLENVKFKVSNEAGDCTLEGFTNSDGILRFNDLTIGKYIIEELDTLGNYVLLEEKLAANVDADQTVEITVENERRKGNVKVLKVDYDDENIKLENVKFELKTLDGSIVAEGRTDENGELLFDNIVEGKYILHEVETLDDYMLQDNEYSVEVDFEQTIEVLVKNKKFEKIIEVVEVEKEIEKVVEVPVEVEKVVEVPVEVERVIEVEKPVEIEKVVEVEKVVEKPVEVEKVVEIEKVVEKPVEVEKIVEIEKEVEKVIEVPVEVEKTVEVEKVIEVEKVVEKPVEVEKIVEIEKVIEKPVEVEKVVYVTNKELPKTGSNVSIFWYLANIAMIVLIMVSATAVWNLIINKKRQSKI